MTSTTRRISVMNCARRSGWALRLTTLALVAASVPLTVPLGGVARAAEGDETPYSFDIMLAPVCVEGTFPLTVTVDGAPLVGSLTAETDVRGKVSGTLVLSGATFEVSGKVSYGDKKSTLAFTGKRGKDRIAFHGTLEGTLFSGTSKGTGPVATGKNECVVDLSTATPQMARIDVLLAEGKRGAVGGTGMVISCGDAVELGASGKPANFTLKSGKRFKFQAKQQAGDFSWTAKGFGASAVGEALILAPLDPPSMFSYVLPVVEFEADQAATPDLPFDSVNPRGTYAIAPALPTGLTINAASGAIEGTPTEIRALATYTVTASNVAGSATATVQVKTRINRANSFAVELSPLNDDARRHFLRRTRFGVTNADLAALQATSVDAYLTPMLTFANGSAAETTAYNTELVNASDPPGLEGKFPSNTQVARWWANLLTNNPNPFQEEIAFFWHDHFAVSTANFDGANNTFPVDYANLLRHEGNGNLRTLLLHVARDPAMLLYLDGVTNTKSAPNENFGREFWELFSLGVDNGYTQADIVAVSKAWSGYRLRFNSTTNLNYVEFDTSRHDPNAKTFLGVTIPGQNVTDDYQAVVDATVNNRPVAEFITKKLFEHFCYRNPPQALVDEMAAYLRAQNYELTPFFRALLTSEAFFSAKSRRSHVKNPVDFGVGYIRSTALTLRTSSLDSLLNTLGQRPSQPPTVDGWPQGELWLSSQGLADRTNLAYNCVEGTALQGPAGNVANLLQPVVTDRTPANVVDRLAGLLDVTLTTTDRTELINYLNTQRQTNGTIISSPFDGGNQTHLDERVRGLLLILAQHPEYQLR